MNLKHWSTSLESDMPIKRHFDAPSDLDPLFLIRCSYHDFTLTLTFVSLTAPLRRSTKWSTKKDSGTEIELVGDCCQLLHIEGMNLDVESTLEVSTCEINALQCVDEKYIDINFSFRSFKNNKVTINTTPKTLNVSS